MNSFEASNGYMIELELNTIGMRNRGGRITHSLGAYSVDALREFFRAERDEEIGRWRWPENPDYLVYPPRGDVLGSGRGVLVFNESTRVLVDAWEFPGANPPKHPDALKAARAYFEAHDERKPLDGAKVGELWELTMGDGSEHTVFIHEDRAFGGRYGVSPGGAFFEIDDDTDVTAARRVWPEEES